MILEWFILQSKFAFNPLFIHTSGGKIPLFLHSCQDRFVIAKKGFYLYVHFTAHSKQNYSYAYIKDSNVMYFSPAFYKKKKKKKVLKPKYHCAQSKKCHYVSFETLEAKVH